MKREVSKWKFQAVSELLQASGLQFTQVSKILNVFVLKKLAATIRMRSNVTAGSRSASGACGEGDRKGGLQQVPIPHSLPLQSLWRRAALSWIREHGSDQGVVYFADDDNSYDTRIFEEIRKTQWVVTWEKFSQDFISNTLPPYFCSYITIQGVCQCSQWVWCSSTAWALRSWETAGSPASMTLSRLDVRWQIFLLICLTIV